MTSGLETERVNSQRKRQVREEINKEKVGKHMIKTSKQYIYIAQKSKIEARAHRSRAQYASELPRACQSYIIATDASILKTLMVIL